MKRILALIVVCLPIGLASSCAGAASSGYSIVAHRGASHDAPENTLPAFTLAWERGADAIEADFYLTRDGFVVAHHDRTTKKTAGVDIPVQEQTLAELKALDVGAWKDPTWAGERIPTLQEVLEIVPPGKVILIEPKSDPSIVPALVRIIVDCGLDLDQIVVICFDAEVIESVERRLPSLKTLWLSDFEETAPGEWRPTAREMVRTATRIRADGVDVKAQPTVLDEAYVRTLREAGLEVHVWTVNEPALAKRMIELGVDSITTDRPGWLRERIAGGR